jgi:hypothetical protein
MKRTYFHLIAVIGVAAFISCSNALNGDALSAPSGAVSASAALHAVPKRTLYDVGEYWQRSDLTVELVLPNGTIRNVAVDDVTITLVNTNTPVGASYTKNTAGSQIFTVTYAEKSDNFTLTWGSASGGGGGGGGGSGDTTVIIQY